MNNFNFPSPSHENTVIELLKAGKVDTEARILLKNNVYELNNGQQNIWATLKPLIDRDEGGLFIIDYPGGTGKKIRAM